MYYQGDSPRWDDARLRSAHARNYRECIGKIEAANATLLPRGTYNKNKSRFSEKKANTRWNQIQ